MVRSNSATIGIIALGAVALFAIASFHAGTDMDSLSVVARSLNLRAAEARCSGRSPCEDGEGRCRIDKQCVNSCIDGYCGSAVEDEPCRDGYVKNRRGDCEQVEVEVPVRVGDEDVAARRAEAEASAEAEYQEGLKARKAQEAADELAAAKRKADGEAQVAAEKAKGEEREAAKAAQVAADKATKEARENEMAKMAAAEKAEGDARWAAMKADEVAMAKKKADRLAEMAKMAAAEKAAGEARQAQMQAEAAVLKKARAERQAVFDAAAAAPAPAPTVDPAEVERQAGMAKHAAKLVCNKQCKADFNGGRNKVARVACIAACKEGGSKPARSAPAPVKVAPVTPVETLRSCTSGCKNADKPIKCRRACKKKFQ